jgi:hypothetical protein
MYVLFSNELVVPGNEVGVFVALNMLNMAVAVHSVVVQGMHTVEVPGMHTVEVTGMYTVEAQGALLPLSSCELVPEAAAQPRKEREIKS